MSEQLERLLRLYKAEYGVSLADIAAIVGTSVQQLAAKRKGEREFTAREVVGLLDMLNGMLDEPMVFDDLFAILPEVNRVGTWAEGYVPPKPQKPRRTTAVYHRTANGSFVKDSRPNGKDRR